MRISSCHPGKKHHAFGLCKNCYARQYQRTEGRNKKAVRKFHLRREYGWTEQDVRSELERQNYSCYGCLAKIDRDSLHIDHDHVNKSVRGLLCGKCNMGIGLLSESPSTLRRLMAYLDHDRKMVNVYLIGALKNSRVPQVGNALRELGLDVMDEWFTPGEFADTNWQAYETMRGRTYSEALKGRAATNIFLFDRSYLDLSDIAILVMPAGKSGMLELGYAKGRGKRTAIFLDGVDPDRYDIMPNFADAVISTEQELIDWVKNEGRP